MNRSAAFSTAASASRKNASIRHLSLCLALAASLSLACGGPADPADAADPGSQPPAAKAPLATAPSASLTASNLSNGVAATGLAGSAGSYTWFHIELPTGASNLKVALGTGTAAANDADLYVRFGDATASSFDCQSYAVGLTDSCAFASPAAGSWSVLVYGYTRYSGASLVASWDVPSSRPRGATLSVHLSMGLPDGSTADVANPNHYLSIKPQFVASYNSSRKEPNWVAWELDSTWLGSADRTNSFRTDSTLPPAIPQASLADYSGSGFDRGHLCASADRTANATDNASTFVLSNVVPQAADSNRGPWEKLETYERSLANAGYELFIVAGGLYGPAPRTIGNGVKVPDAMFKVIVVGNAAGAQGVTTSTRVIAVVVPNDDSQVAATDDWRSFRTSARAIETQSGLDFLSDVPRSIQDVVETRVDAL